MIARDSKRQPKPELRQLAARMRQLRKVRGLTQEELEDETGVRQGTISAIENAIQRPQRGTLMLLATGLGYSVEDMRRFLFEGVPLTVQIRPEGHPDPRPAHRKTGT